MNKKICPACGGIMQDRIYDEDAGRWYWECWNRLENEKYCFNTEWE